MFYGKFEWLCRQRGESVAHVCKQIGIFPTTAHDWKNGARPRNSTVKKIADYFGVDVSYFDDETLDHKDDSLVRGFIEEMQNKERLTEDESLLLQMFRTLSDGKKQELLRTAMRMKLEDEQ